MSLSKPGRLGPHKRLRKAGIRDVLAVQEVLEVIGHVTRFTPLPEAGRQDLLKTRAQLHSVHDTLAQQLERIQLLETELEKVHDYYGTPPREPLPPPAPGQLVLDEDDETWKMT